MPLYEYKCASCGETFEIIQKFSDPALEVHEKCGGHVERLISASALQFKGSGWYVNDYGNGKIQPSKDGKNESNKSEINRSESNKSESNRSESNRSESKKEGKSEGSTSSGDSSAKTETKAPATTSSSTSDKKV
jgi:putative FmdB family regulatory protein